MVTFDGLVEVVPVLPRGDVGGLVLSAPQEDALVLRAARQVLSVVAARVQKKFPLKTAIIDAVLYANFTKTSRLHIHGNTTIVELHAYNKAGRFMR